VSFGLRPDELLAWADRHGAAIIEDDDDTEVRYSGRRLEPLYTVDTTGRTIFVGSLSMTMLTTLRIGFVISPPALFVCLARGEVRDRLAPPSRHRPRSLDSSTNACSGHVESDCGDRKKPSGSYFALTCRRRS
jgi:hypothetical protein